jgi:hypothetical protein
MRGSIFQNTQRGELEINKLLSLKIEAESKMKAYLSERKKEFSNRGTITHMSRDAHPNYLLYTHVKIKPSGKISS